MAANKRVFTLSLPDEVFDKIGILATKEHRSVMNYIEYVRMKHLAEVVQESKKIKTGGTDTKQFERRIVMKRKWTKVLAAIFVLVLFFMLAALAVVKWTDQMDPNTPPPAERPWRQIRNNLLVSGAGLCAMLVCVAVRGRGRRLKDDTDSEDMPWEK